MHEDQFILFITWLTTWYTKYWWKEVSHHFHCN